MKHHFWSLLPVLLLFFLLGGACAWADADISSPEDLAQLAQDPYGTYLLVKDIDMEGIDWTPIAFHGTLNGNGFGLYNLTIETTGEERLDCHDANGYSHSCAFAGLFSDASNAVIENLDLPGLEIRLEEETGCFAAGIAGYISHTEIRNCRVEGRITCINHDRMDGVGGIAGFGSGMITGCEANVELILDDYAERPDEGYLGGILACGFADLTDCRVQIRGFHHSRGFVHAGGIVGLYDRCGLDYQPQQVANCYSEGIITFNERNGVARKAYCADIFGERLSNPQQIENNTSSFTRDEIFDHRVNLMPEKCGQPDYETKSGALCGSWSYTEYICRGCGYSYRDQYAPSEHQSGAWTETVPASDTEEGREARYCDVCGICLEERVIPRIETVEEPKEDEETESSVMKQTVVIPKVMNLRYRAGGQLTATTESGETVEVLWTSQDPSIVEVREQGIIRAVGEGRAIVTAEFPDGSYAGECIVGVTMSPWQLVIKYILFGWLWY